MKLNIKFKVFFNFGIFLLGAILIVFASPTALWSEETLTKQCLECHESEVIPELSKSIHNDADCADCHYGEKTNPDHKEFNRTSLQYFRARTTFSKR